MNFSSLAEFIAMGGHALYVWSAYGFSLLVLAINVGGPLLAKRHYLQEQARRLRREELK
ncbi:MAG: heme exporter protein D [Pseudomonas sp.]|jgi:heme exporter protein D